MNKSFLQRIGIYPLISLAVIFWGMSYVWTTIVFKYYHPISTIFIRLVISSALLVGYTFLSGKAEKIKKEDRWLLLISALFNPFLYFLFENYGLKNSTPTISAVIIATIPVFVSIVGYFMLKENLSLINIIGILVSFLGIGIMLVNPDFSLNSSWAGILFLSGAVVMAVIYTVLLKRLAHKYSALTIITYQNMIGVIYFLPLFLFFDYKYFITVRPNFELVYSLLSLAVFASTLAFISQKDRSQPYQRFFKPDACSYCDFFCYLYLRNLHGDQDNRDGNRDCGGDGGTGEKESIEAWRLGGMGAGKRGSGK